MKNDRYTIAALALCVLSFGASAATPVPPSGHQDHTQVGIAKASDVEVRILRPAPLPPENP